MKSSLALSAALLLAACSAPEAEPAPFPPANAPEVKGDAELTCLMARGWAAEVKACRASPRCMADPTNAYDVEIMEGDIKAANQHFGCAIP